MRFLLVPLLVLTSVISQAGTHFYVCKAQNDLSEDVYLRVNTGHMFKEGVVSWATTSPNFYDSPEYNAKFNDFRSHHEVDGFQCVSRMNVYLAEHEGQHDPYLIQKHCLNDDVLSGNRKAKYVKIEISGDHMYEDTGSEKRSETLYDCTKMD